MVPVKPSLVMVDSTSLSWGAGVKAKVEKELGIERVKLFGFHSSPVCFGLRQVFAPG